MCAWVPCAFHPRPVSVRPSPPYRANPPRPTANRPFPSPSVSIPLAFRFHPPRRPKSCGRCIRPTVGVLLSSTREVVRSVNPPRTPPRRYTYGQILYTYDTPTAEDLWVKTAINRKQGKTAYKQKIPHLRGFSSRLMVAKAGIEPATHGFSVRCSTN